MSIGAAIAAVVLEKGRPSTPYEPDEWHSWTYGNWHMDGAEIQAHSRVCPFTPTGPGQAVEWSEFQDTDADNLHKHGIYVVAACECGAYGEVTWLYESTLGELMRDLLASEEQA
jgi:hypothetical protein